MKKILLLLSLAVAATSAQAVDNPVSCTGANCSVLIKPRNASAVATTGITVDGATSTATFATGIKLPTVGGTPSLLDFNESKAKTSTLAGATTAPSVTLRQTRVGDMVVITMTGFGTVTKDGSSGFISFAIDSEFAPAAARSVINFGLIGNAATSVLWTVTGSTIQMSSNIGGSVITAGQTQVGCNINLTFFYTIN